MSKKDQSVVPLFGIPILSASNKEVLELCLEGVEKNPLKKMLLVFTPNPEQITLSFHNQVFRETLKQATWNIPDGYGVVWALNRKLGLKERGQKVHRVPGRELFHDLLGEARLRGWRVFLLGGRPGSARMVASKYQVPNTQPLFFFGEGAKDISHETKEEEQRVLASIENAKPKILFVAYGAPWQEQWLVTHEEELTRIGVRLAMVVGGAFDYEAGLVPPVPAVFVQAHLEWFWRLWREPWRWKRQLRGLEFFWRVLSTVF